MPGPVSSTCSTTTWPKGSGITRAVTVPPAGVYCSALSTRLRTSSRTSTGWPCDAGRVPSARRALVAQVDALVHRLGHEVAHGFAHQFGQVQRSTRSACSLSSARAIASSWLTMCAARWLTGRSAAASASAPAGRRGRCRSRARPVRPACAARPAASSAGARHRPGSALRAMDWSSRCSRSLMALTSGATSSGTSRSAIGLRSVLSRRRMRCCSSASGGCRAPAPTTPAAPPAAGSRTAAGSRP
jgi:hypothetical protein